MFIKILLLSFGLIIQSQSCTVQVATMSGKRFESNETCLSSFAKDIRRQLAEGVALGPNTWIAFTQDGNILDDRMFVIAYNKALKENRALHLHLVLTSEETMLEELLNEPRSEERSEKQFMVLRSWSYKRDIKSCSTMLSLISAMRADPLRHGFYLNERFSLSCNAFFGVVQILYFYPHNFRDAIGTEDMVKNVYRLLFRLLKIETDDDTAPDLTLPEGFDFHRESHYVYLLFNTKPMVSFYKEGKRSPVENEFIQDKLAAFARVINKIWPLIIF